MSTDSNLELTSLVHTMQARSHWCITQLKTKLEAVPDSTHIEIRSEGATNLIFLLEAQSQLLAKLFEENVSIHDKLARLLLSYLDK